MLTIFKEKYSFNQTLVALFGVVTAVLFLAKPGEFWLQIVIGIWVSFIFYFLVTAFPAYSHKQRQKNAFFAYYKQFKEDVIQELLLLINYQDDDYELKEKLLETTEFRNFFQQQSPIAGQTYTHVLLNALANEENLDTSKRISESFRQLEREVDYLTRSLSIEDTTLLVQLRNLSRLMGDGRFDAEIDPNREDESRFVGALFEVFSGWNIVNGETGDFIRKWVEKI